MLLKSQIAALQLGLVYLIFMFGILIGCSSLKPMPQIVGISKNQNSTLLEFKRNITNGTLPIYKVLDLVDRATVYQIRPSQDVRKIKASTINVAVAPGVSRAELLKDNVSMLAVVTSDQGEPFIRRVRYHALFVRNANIIAMGYGAPVATEFKLEMTKL